MKYFRFKRFPRRTIFLVVLFFATAFIWWVVVTEDRGGLLKVTFLDVGQGDAILIDTPHGNQFLIDGGAGRQVLRSLGRELPFWNRSIEAVLASHADTDHAAGLRDVLSRYTVRAIFLTATTSDNKIFDQLASAALAEPAQVINPSAGTKINLDKGVVLEIIYPPIGNPGPDTNDQSVVARLTYGQTNFLFTGDISAKIGDFLAAAKADQIKADVLKVPHHGARSSHSLAFIKAVDPDYAVISAGINNRYGHPHQEVIDDLQARNIEILRTANGVSLYADGGSIVTR